MPTTSVCLCLNCRKIIRKFDISQEPTRLAKAHRPAAPARRASAAGTAGGEGEVQNKKAFCMKPAFPSRFGRVVSLSETGGFL